jgi:hypothetical protein
MKFARESRLGTAWILLCSSPAYEAEAASFGTFVKTIDEWDKQVGGDSKISFERAYLDYLSRLNGGTHPSP